MIHSEIKQNKKHQKTKWSALVGIAAAVVLIFTYTIVSNKSSLPILNNLSPEKALAATARKYQNDIAEYKYCSTNLVQSSYDANMKKNKSSLEFKYSFDNKTGDNYMSNASITDNKISQVDEGLSHKSDLNNINYQLSRTVENPTNDDYTSDNGINSKINSNLVVEINNETILNNINTYLQSNGKGSLDNLSSAKLSETELLSILEKSKINDPIVNILKNDRAVQVEKKEEGITIENNKVVANPPTTTPTAIDMNGTFDDIVVWDLVQQSKLKDLAEYISKHSKDATVKKDKNQFVYTFSNLGPNSPKQLSVIIENNQIISISLNNSIDGESFILEEKITKYSCSNETPNEFNQSYWGIHDTAALLIANK